MAAPGLRVPGWLRAPVDGHPECPLAALPSLSSASPPSISQGSLVLCPSSKGICLALPTTHHGAQHVCHGPRTSLAPFSQHVEPRDPCAVSGTHGSRAGPRTNRLSPAMLHGPSHQPDAGPQASQRSAICRPSVCPSICRVSASLHGLHARLSVPRVSHSVSLVLQWAFLVPSPPLEARSW